MKNLKSVLLEKRDIRKEITGIHSNSEGTRLVFGLVDYDNIEKRFDNTEWMTIKATSPTAKTEIQEKFTALIFNTYKENLDQMDKELTIERLPYALKIDKNNELWLTSVKGQVKTIVEFLRKEKWNISNLIAVHYLEDDPIARNIMVLHSSLSGTLNNRPKDAIDPSDIIIYDKTKVRDINKFQDTLMSGGGINKEFLSEYKALIKLLISNHLYVGISLKKGDTFSAHYNNYIEAPDAYSNVKITNITKTPQNLKVSFSAYNETLNKNTNFDFRISAQGGRHAVIELQGYKYAQGGKGTWAILDARNPKEQLELDFNDKEGIVKYPKFLINSDWDQKLVNDFLEEEHPVTKNNNHTIDTEIFNIFKYIIENNQQSAITLMYYCAKIGDECAPYLMISPN